MSILDVLNWKFPTTEGIVVRNMVITDFPGGVPTQQEQDAWAAEYAAYIVEYTKSIALKAEMYRVLADGLMWKYNNPASWFTVSIDDEMQGFLTRTLLKLNEGRIDPHGGFIRSNGLSVSIDDVGMRELCIFAGMWGDAISAIRILTLDTIVDWEAFDPYSVDWSVTWTGPDMAAGWSNNTLTQIP